MGVTVGSSDALLKVDVAGLHIVLKQLADLANALEVGLERQSVRLSGVEAAGMDIASLEKRLTAHFDQSPPAWATRLPTAEQYAEMLTRLEEEVSRRQQCERDMHALGKRVDTMEGNVEAVQRQTEDVHNQLRRESSEALRILEARVRSAETKATECRDDVRLCRADVDGHSTSLRALEEQLRSLSAASQEALDLATEVVALQRGASEFSARMDAFACEMEGFKEAATMSMLQDVRDEFELRLQALQDSTRRLPVDGAAGADAAALAALDRRLLVLEETSRAMARGLLELEAGVLRAGEAAKPPASERESSLTYCLACASPRTTSPPRRANLGSDGVLYSALGGEPPSRQARPLGGSPPQRSRARATTPSIPSAEATLSCGLIAEPSTSLAAIGGTGLPRPPVSITAATPFRNDAILRVPAANIPTTGTRPRSAGAGTKMVSKSLPAFDRSLAAALIGKND